MTDDTEISPAVPGNKLRGKILLKWPKEAENEGFDSLWVLERLLAPLAPKTPYPATPDGSFPPQYQNVLDPLVTLSYVAPSLIRSRCGHQL